jgi:hypothetical protein
MPRPLLSPFGKRQPRALVIGLRCIVKDPNATVAERLEACRLLAVVEGYIQGRPKERARDTEKRTQDSAPHPPMSPQNANRLRELLNICKDS